MLNVRISALCGLLMLSPAIVPAEELADPFVQPINWVSRDAPLSAVLEGIAEAYGVNVVGTHGLDQPVTVNLRGVPLNRALEAILADQGIGYEVRGDIVVLRDGELLETAIYPVHFADLDEVGDIMRGLLSDQGSLSIQSRSNQLVITDVLSRHQRVSRTLSRLDQYPSQVQIESQIINISENNVKELGVEWGGAGEDSTTLGEQDLISRTNRQGEQEVVNGTVSVPAPETELSVLNPVIEYATVFTHAGRRTALEMQLDALVQRGKAEVLSKPRITVLNRETARIIVGQQVPFNTRTTLTAGGNETSETEFKEVGIKLEVTPTIAERGFIIIDIRPEVSEISRADLVTFEDPPITTTAAETKIVLEDGQTGIIGGLISGATSIVNRDIPWLSRIPIVSFLFKSRADTFERSELMVIVTPTIIRQGMAIPGIGKLGESYEHRQGAVPEQLDRDVHPEELADPNAPNGDQAKAR